MQAGGGKSSVVPDKADAPLVVDADAVLPVPISFLRLY
jgi:hypothetical protein